MKRPASLTIAVVLQWIAAIAGLWAGSILMVGSLAIFDESARDEIAKALSEAGVTNIDPAMVGMAFLVFSLLIIIVSIIRLIIAIALGKGRSWARIVLTVLSALSLAGAIGQVFGCELLTGLISAVIEIVILWLLWNSASSAYIKAKTAEHAAAKA